MSPIASTPVAFALSTATPSVALDPDIAGQSASTMSQYLAGTGGFVFVAVAIVSVAGYFYHGRGTANNTRKNTTWATFSSFLSAMRHRGSGTTTEATGSGWPPDVEGGFEQHVSMVYARFFHPTFWNLVECHPATASAPAIYVEDEANEIPALEPKPYGMNSYLDMDDDDGEGEGEGEGDKKTSKKTARENADQGAQSRVAKTPPYDTSSATHVRFKSAIIGTTDRLGGAFLCVPGRYEDGSFDTSSSETSSSCELDMACSPYDGILDEPEPGPARSPYDGIVKIPRTPDGTFGTSPDSGVASGLAYLNDSQEFTCSPHDGMLTTPGSPGGTTSDSKLDFSCLPYDGTVTDCHPDINSLPYVGTSTTPMRSPHSARRYGMADMAKLARTLKHSIPEEGSGLGLVRTIGCQSGLCDLTDDTESEVESATSYRHLDRIETADDKTISSDCDVNVRDNRDGVREDWSDGDTFAPPHKGPVLMQRILEELRDASMDCTSRALSEDSNFESDEDDIIDDDEETVLELAPTWSLDTVGQTSSEWTSSAGSGVYNGGSIYPFTPPAGPSVVLLNPRCVYKPGMARPAVTFWSNAEVQVAVPTSSDSPVWSPSSPYVRRHRRCPSVVCGPIWLPY